MKGSLKWMYTFWASIAGEPTIDVARMAYLCVGSGPGLFVLSCSALRNLHYTGRTTELCFARACERCATANCSCRHRPHPWQRSVMRGKEYPRIRMPRMVACRNPEIQTPPLAYPHQCLPTARISTAVQGAHACTISRFCLHGRIHMPILRPLVPLFSRPRLQYQPTSHRRFIPNKP